MTLFFYIFASLVILGSSGVVVSRNSVHSVLWLIFVFCNAAGLFVLLGAEFLAMTLVIVYVGAVAVLFLFVVMMLGNHFMGIRSTILQKRYRFLGAIVLCALLFDLTLVMFAGNNSLPAHAISQVSTKLTNTHAIGSVLYTDFMLPFQISGVILFVAMVGCIVLTLDVKRHRKRQTPDEQLAHSKENCMRIAHVPSNQGVDGIMYD
jgi:NADH-quinone oxidoreductase subunit J